MYSSDIDIFMQILYYFQQFIYFIYFIPAATLLITSIIAILKTQNYIFILNIIGSSITLLAVFSNIILRFALRYNSITKISIFYEIVFLFSFLGSSLFAAGLLIYFIKLKKNPDINV